MLDIRPDNRDTARELTDGNQELTKENEYPVQFDKKPDQRPPEEDQGNPCGEGSGAFELLATGEESDSFLDSDDEGQAYEEEDLHALLTATQLFSNGKEGTDIAHCQPGKLS